MKNNYLNQISLKSLSGSLLVGLLLLFSANTRAQCTTPGPGEVAVEIIMQAQGFGSEMRWVLSDSATSTLIEDVNFGFYPTSSTNYGPTYAPEHQLCVPGNTTLKFEAFDSFGDGWNGGTFYMRVAETKDTVFQYNLPSGLAGTTYFVVPPPAAQIHICNGTMAPPFNNIDSIVGGSGNYAITWQVSSDQNSWSDAPGNNDSLTYQSPDTHFDTKYFRRRVIDTTCGDTAYSNVLILNVPDSLMIDSVGLSDISCFGAGDGELEAFVIGGRPPYTYAWSNGDSTATTDSLTSGTYFLTVTDLTGCTYSDTFTIVEPAPIALSITLQKPVVCPGANDGELLAVPGGGVPPYSFLWSNGDTTALADTISAGTYTVIMLDSNGCQGFDTITVTDFDLVNPSVQTQNLTTYLTNNGTSVISSAMVDNGSSDVCGIKKMYLSDSIFACTHLGVNTRYLIVEDNSGNVDSASFTVTVLDTISPVTNTKNTTIYLDATGIAVLDPNTVNSGSSDNCNTLLTVSQDTFTCADEGLQLRNLIVTDNSGNSSSASFLVDVQDTISPTLVTRSITLQLGATGQATIAPSQLDGGSSDNCSNQLFYSASKTSFDCNDLGSNQVTLTITDQNGNSSAGIATVVVEDNLNPTAIAQNLTVNLDASGQGSITAAMADNGSSDNCSIDSIWISQSQFGCADLGSNSAVLTVRDTEGNTNTANFIVTVQDLIAPTVTGQPITVHLDANGNASITANDINNGSADNCGLSGLSLDVSSFDCSNLGANIVTLTATDAAGNSTGSQVTVTVLDTSRPNVATQNITVSLDASGNASISTGMIDNGSSDNCQISSLSLSQTSFGCQDVGVNTVTLTVTDNSGNQNTATATVTVVDNIAPNALAQNLMVNLDANGLGSITAAMADNGSSDNCGVDSIWVSQTQFSCADLGINSLTLTVRDAEDNLNTASFIVTVQDLIAPSVSAQAVSVYLDTNGMAGITTSDIDNGSGDNCGIASLNLDVSSFDCSDLGANTVTLSATDGSGNSASSQAVVTVIDTIKPKAVTQNITLALDASGNASITTSMIDNGSSDNCQISSMSLSQTSFTCANIGSNNVSLTITDNSGNQRSASANVTVIDNMAPVVVTQTQTIYLDQNGQASITAQDINNGSSDNCGIASLSADVTLFDCADLGQNLVTLSVTDNEGNVGTGSTFVTVLDTITPTIDNLPANITAYADPGQCGTNVQWPTITGSDNCNVTSVLSNQLNGSFFALGTTTVNVTVSDPSGNSVAQSFTITIVDTVSPVLSNIPSSFQIVPNAGSCDAVVTWTNPTATDNCVTPTVTSTHNSGGTFPVGTTTVTYTATDNNGNSTTASFDIVISDIVPPTILNIPNDTTISNSAAACEGIVNYPAASVTDNCTGASLTYSQASGTAFSLGTTTVTITATDGAGNVSTASFDVTVEDNEKPVPTFVPASDTVGVCSANYSYQPVTGADNCGVVTVTQTAGLPSGSIFPAGTTQNVFRIRDAAGNDSIVSFSVTVVPQGLPNITNLLEICANAAPVDISLGQSTMVWTGPGVTGGNTFNPQLAGPGRHSLNYTFTDNYNCSVSGVITVTVLPVPLTPVIIQVGTTTLGVQGAYTTYQWYRDGVMIPGAVNSTYSYTVGGNYQVMVGNASGCLNFGTGFVIGSGAGGIGIEELDLTTLEVFPNPTDGIINIQLSSSQAADLDLELMSLEGKLVYKERVKTGETGMISLDFSHLPTATYILRIYNNDGVANRRIIIK